VRRSRRVMVQLLAMHAPCSDHTRAARIESVSLSLQSTQRPSAQIHAVCIVDWYNWTGDATKPVQSDLSARTNLDVSGPSTSFALFSRKATHNRVNSRTDKHLGTDIHRSQKVHLHSCSTVRRRNTKTSQAGPVFHMPTAKSYLSVREISE
jgi:hypothetical protein